MAAARATDESGRVGRWTEILEGRRVNYMSTQSTRVGVVGLGYVGLPLALSMHNAGYEVVGVDVDGATVERLQAGESTVNDVSDAEVTDAVAEGLRFTTDYGELADADGVSVCVPTPLRKTDTQTETPSASANSP